MTTHPRRHAPVPEGIGADFEGFAELLAVPYERGPTMELVPAPEMALLQPELSAARIGQTRALFQEFLDHLDRLGLAEPATHVSLAFERFLAMYPANPAGD